MNNREITEKLTEQIFKVRYGAKLQEAKEKETALDRKHSAQGMLNSGGNVKQHAEIRVAALLVAAEDTVRELSREFRTQRRRDPETFWSTAGKKLTELVEAQKRPLSEGYIHEMKRRNFETQAQVCLGAALNSLGRIRQQLEEERLKGHFQIAKSAEDRKARQIPDVAVMMWFPSKEDESNRSAADQRFEAIRRAVNTASGGQASFNKFDDPEITAQDRISESVEEWILRTAIVIADLGGHRQNVYYEIGYAKAAGTDLILCCPHEDFDATPLHIKSWPLLIYANADDLSNQLVEKVKTLLVRYDLSQSSISSP